MKRRLIILFALLLSALAMFSCVHIEKPEDTSSETTKFIDTDEDLSFVTAPEETTSSKTEKETTEEVTTAGPYAVNNSDEAIEAAKEYLGTVDEDTGYKYGFSYDSQITDNGMLYYKIRVSWHIEEEDRFSLCGYLLVDVNGNVSKYNW